MLLPLKKKKKKVGESADASKSASARSSDAEKTSEPRQLQAALLPRVI